MCWVAGSNERRVAGAGSLEDNRDAVRPFWEDSASQPAQAPAQPPQSRDVELVVSL